MLNVVVISSNICNHDRAVTGDSGLFLRCEPIEIDPIPTPYSR